MSWKAGSIGRLRAGAAAGIVGTAVLSLLSAEEERRRRRPAVYDPRLMAERLARRHLHVRIGRRNRDLAGLIMRWPYGAGWGSALATVRPRIPWPLSGVLLGAAIFVFEITGLPALKATPALRRWPFDQVVTDGVNALVYGLVTAATLRMLGRHR
jgi:hypothetical protein